MGYAPERGEYLVTELDVTNPLGGAAIQIIPLIPTSASTSVGGALNIDNSLNTGAGMVVFSSQSAPSGRLIVGRSSSATFSQTVAFFQQAGTGHALHADLTQTNSATASALNVTSANAANSAVFVSGVETGRGTIKVAHTGDTAVASDAAAAAISIDLKTSGVSGATAAQGIFIDATTGGTTGDLMDLRNNGNQLFKFGAVGLTRPLMTLGNGGPTISTGTGSPDTVVTAPVGSIFLRTDGATNVTVLYVKRTGTGNSGWFPVTT